MKRILTIDDDPSVRNVLHRGLSYEGFAVEVAENGEVGLAKARERLPDLVVLDRMMPGLDGMEVLRRLRAVDASLPIIMLTGMDAPADQVDGLEGGANDYVVKPFSFDVLLARINAALRHQTTTGSLLRYADVAMDIEAFSARRGQRELKLTNLEFKTLREFLEYPERVMSKQKLLDRIWGSDFFGNDNIVEVYIKLLRQKLEEQGEARLIHTIRNVGYVMRES
ncbi:MAG: response regulator transcription factor [Pleurocapsa sp. SU_196_0]|nr:response regulator transcription factor [Pleurocapsa sp. SU_196_0]